LIAGGSTDDRNSAPREARSSGCPSRSSQPPGNSEAGWQDKQGVGWARTEEGSCGSREFLEVQCGRCTDPTHDTIPADDLPCTRSFAQRQCSCLELNGSYREVCAGLAPLRLISAHYDYIEPNWATDRAAAKHPRVHSATFHVKRTAAAEGEQWLRGKDGRDP
jgi:hypothetical protein